MFCLRQKVVMNLRLVLKECLEPKKSQTVNIVCSVWIINIKVAQVFSIGIFTFDFHPFLRGATFKQNITPYLVLKRIGIIVNNYSSNASSHPMNESRKYSVKGVPTVVIR